jgi:hypothetical protein
MDMVKGALDDDRILGGIITLLMLAVAGVVIGIVLWTANAELAPIAAVEQTGTVGASPAPNLGDPADVAVSFTSRGHVVPTF